jgi:hypothetical protein
LFLRIKLCYRYYLNIGKISLLLWFSFIVGQSAWATTSPQMLEPTSITLNETLIASTRKKLPVDDPIAIFRYIFKQLPKQVLVYPTENYYYFQFGNDGARYWGNIRLSPDVRDKGFIHFAYSRLYSNDWSKYRLLGKKHGVAVIKVEPFQYRIKFEGKEIDFILNNLPQELPATVKHPNQERYIGRTMDESGFQFWLFYNQKDKYFLWVLDESEGLNIPFRKLTNDILFHSRSAFAFYADNTYNRKILIGVNVWNTMANNYFDGPFDQLPDNFIEETKFSDYAQDAFPSVRGKINKRGEFLDNEQRLAIAPYMSYKNSAEVAQWVTYCKSVFESASRLYKCILTEQMQATPPKANK